MYLTTREPKGNPSGMNRQLFVHREMILSVQVEGVAMTFEQMLQLHAKTCFNSGSWRENLKAPQWQLP